MISLICNICKKKFETKTPFESVLIDLDGIKSACDDCRDQLSIGGAMKRYQKLWHDRIDSAFNEKENRLNLTNQVLEQVLIVLSLPHIDLKLKTKFDKGMAEHGAGFDRVDFDVEIENEVLDICNYLIGKNYSKKENENV